MKHFLKKSKLDKHASTRKKAENITLKTLFYKKDMKYHQQKNFNYM